MTELIRVTQGQETPAPGRWNIAPDQPVDIRTGGAWRSHRRTGRVKTGQLLIAQDGVMAFRAVIKLTESAGIGPNTVVYQSIRIDRSRIEDSWPMAGELFVQGRIVPAHGLLTYHGVFRSGSGAVAWLGWHLPRIRIPGPDRRFSIRMGLSADLNADAPEELRMPKNRNGHPRRTPARPATNANTLPSCHSQETPIIMTVISLGRQAHPVLPVLALVAVAVTWGVTFSVVDDAGQLIPPADLVAWRFGVATLALYMIRRRRVLPSALHRRGIVLGGLLGLGFLLQAWALTDTDAAMSGFLIGTLVVLAPIIGWAVFRVRPALATWIGVAVATAGLAMLSLQGGGFGRGEILTLLAHGTWALHLVLLSRWGSPDFAVELARIQTLTVTAMAVLAVVLGGVISGGRVMPVIPSDGETWFSIAFLALPATAAAMIALSWAQSRITAARAAIILTLEPAAAAATAAMLGAELGLRTIIGGALLVGAMLIVELGPRWPGRRSRPGRPAHAVVSWWGGAPLVELWARRFGMTPASTDEAGQLVGAGRELPGT